MCKLFIRHLSSLVVRLAGLKCISLCAGHDFCSWIVTTSPSEEGTPHVWLLSVDGSSNLKGSGAGIVLEGPGDLLIEQSLRFEFKASNNQAEYEALIA